MDKRPPSRTLWVQGLVIGLLSVIVITLALAGALAWGPHHCDAAFPKVIGCALGTYEGLSGGLIAAAAALMAGWLAWKAVQRQIDAEDRRASVDRIAAGATEQARLYVVVEADLDWLVGYAKQQQRDHQPTEILTRSFGFKYKFRNYGKTPAIIKNFSIGTKLSFEPFDPVYAMMLEAFSENMIAAGDTTESKSFVVSPPITIGQGANIAANNGALWIYGYIEYEDVFGSAHTHRFYFRTITADKHCLLQSYDYKHYNRST